MTPALRRRFDEHRAIRQSELFELASLLDRHQLTPDPGPVSQAGSLCLAAPRTSPGGMPDAGREYWGYRIDGLQLRLEPQRHCRPRAADVERMVGRLTVDVQEYLPGTAADVESGFNNLRSVNASFHCDADAIFDGELHLLRSAWHVDTHLHADTQSDSVHPRFHFQVGGEDLDDVDATIRGALMLEAPRPAIPPLDGVLAIDFVLSHYCGAAWERLRIGEASYGRIRGASMARLWGPYFRLLADALEGDNTVAQDSPAGLLLPNLALN